MKKTMLLAAISLLAILMVLPVVRFVNVSASNFVVTPGTLSADGWPIPPLPPPAISGETGITVADGWPIPPLPPPALGADAGVLVADGWPIPPLPPPGLQASLSA